MTDYNSQPDEYNNYKLEVKDTTNNESKISRLEILCCSCKDPEGRIKENICKWGYCPKIQITIQ